MAEATYKILVVDDEVDLEPLMLQRMRRDIRSGRYCFVFAHNGVEALEKLSEDEGIDMVLSDINMPQMDGLTLLEQIPTVDPNIKSVIVSAYGDMKNIRTAMNRGAFDFVTKPLDFADLRITIERTLAHLTEWRAALASRDQLVSLQRELDVASKMQKSILPTRFPSKGDYEVFAHMEPARNVGGDFYDVVNLENDRIGLCIADVSDKGVPAALFMMSSRTLLKGASIGCENPGDVLREVNDLLRETNDSEMFVTLLYGIFDPATGDFTYANGGHNEPLLVRPDGTSSLLPRTGGIILGVVPGVEFAHNTVNIGPGETLFLYTDGVSEAMNVEAEEFGMDRLAAIFAENPPRDAEATTMGVFKAVHAFAGETPQSDDITCLTLHRKEPGS
ncbi:MAG: SpoIIE family protein phosphatase [bacterium]|nr:SpoIIE family protein phosphatase [bacterium]MXZ29946.1 SpoIIE family protein phosphatase [Acidimicrobiia bacterium]MYB23806.1 SpoIIE family protein phosphatase [Acidimicrobiia bacterium]